MVLNNDARDLWEPEELRYGEITREILTDGHWFLLHINGVKYPDKPPLFFWLMALTCVATGGMSAWAIRLTSAVAGLGCVLLTYRLGTRLRDERLGVLCAWLLFTTPFFTWTACEARMDMLLTLFIMGALYCFYLDYTSNARPARHWALAHVLMGLAVLTKGPIGYLLPMLTIFLYLLWMRDLAFLRSYRPILGLLISLAVVTPWLVMTCVQGGEQFANEILFRQNTGRYFAAWLHRNPLYHYFKVVPGVFMPWTFLLPGMIAFAFRTKDAETKRRLRFPVVWFLTIFVFFSMSDSKRTIYVVPLIPAAVLWAGLFLREALDKTSPLRAWAVGGIYASAVAFIGVGLGAPIAVKLKHADAFYAALPCCLVLTFGGITVFARARAGRRWASLADVRTCVLAAFAAAMVFVMPYVNTHKSARLMLARFRGIVGPSAEIGLYRSERAGYAFYWGRLLPPLRSRDDLVEFMSREPQGYALMKTKYLAEVQGGAPDDFPVVWSGKLGGRDLVLVGGPEAKKSDT